MLGKCYDVASALLVGAFIGVGLGLLLGASLHDLIVWIGGLI